MGLRHGISRALGALALLAPSLAGAAPQSGIQRPARAFWRRLTQA